MSILLPCSPVMVLALKIAGLRAAGSFAGNRISADPPDQYRAGIGHRPIRTSPFGLLAPSSVSATLNRLSNGITLAFRPRLSTPQWRPLGCPGLMPPVSTRGRIDHTIVLQRVLQPKYSYRLRSSWSSGFILGAVTRRHRPWVISTVRESATLCTLPRFGIAYAGRFYGILATNNSSAGGLPWVRRITSLYPVQLHSGSVHRISGLALPRLLDLLAAAI